MKTSHSAPPAKVSLSPQGNFGTFVLEKRVLMTAFTSFMIRTSFHKASVFKTTIRPAVSAAASPHWCHRTEATASADLHVVFRPPACWRVASWLPPVSGASIPDLWPCHSPGTRFCGHSAFPLSQSPPGLV